MAVEALLLAVAADAGRAELIARPPESRDAATRENNDRRRTL